MASGSREDSLNRRFRFPHARSATLDVWEVYAYTEDKAFELQSPANGSEIL